MTLDQRYTFFVNIFLRKMFEPHLYKNESSMVDIQHCQVNLDISAL
jgi:hypothetical protein